MKMENFFTISFEDECCFTLDFVRKAFRDLDDPNNVMRLEDMCDHGTHYSYYYDVEKKNIAKGIAPGTANTEKFYYSESLQMTACHPYGMAYIYGVDPEFVKGKTDKEFFEQLPALRAQQHQAVLKDVDQHLLNDRLAGKLPTLKIFHDTWVVNWAERCLTYELDPEKKIEFSALGHSGEEREYCCLYSHYKHEAFPKDFDIGSAYAVSVLVIPNERELDPVGVARDLGLGDLDLLYKHPLKQQQIAKVYHLPKEKVMTMFSLDQDKQVQRKRGKKM